MHSSCRTSFANILPTLLLAAGGAGCQHNVFSPPARVLPLENPATLGSRQTGVQLEGSVNGGMFADIAGGTARVRHGITREMEASAEASYAQVLNASGAGVDRGIYSGRAGVKFNPVENRYFSSTGGVGGGTSAGGPFISADGGFILGYENRYVVPFFTARGWVSVPMDPHPVDTRRPEDKETRIDTPKETVGYTLCAGLKVQLGPRSQPGDSAAGLLAGLSFTGMADEGAHGEIIGVGFGFEAGF